MPHLSSCLPMAGGATAIGACMLTGWRTLRHRQRDASFTLGAALSGGAVGGLVGLAVGVTICVIRDRTDNPLGGPIWAWVSRFLVFAGPALIVGAMLGAITAVFLTWALARRRSGTDGGPA